LTYGGLAFFTVILVSVAVLGVRRLREVSSRPIALYRRLALAVLAVSMLPDAWLPGNVPARRGPSRSRSWSRTWPAWLPTVLILTNRAIVGRGRPKGLQPRMARQRLTSACSR
jgi:hypothetical protein